MIDGNPPSPALAVGSRAPMPDEPAQARGFSAARRARATALLEDYVELIADLADATGEARTTEIAKRLGVTHPTAIKAIGRLKAAGLATARPYRGIFLTPDGLALARRVKARHQLVIDTLLAIGVPRETAETDAEGIEHHVSDATLAAFKRFLADVGLDTTKEGAGGCRPPAPSGHE